MKTLKIWMPLALLLCALAFTSAQAAKIKLLHDNLGVPFTRAYIKQQRLTDVHRMQMQLQNSYDIYMSLPMNVSGYDNWEIDFKQYGQILYSYTTAGKDVYAGPILNIPEGTYDIDFTCFDEYWKGFDIQAYWWVDTGGGYAENYKHYTASNAYYSAVTLYSVPVTEPAPGYDDYLQIDGND